LNFYKINIICKLVIKYRKFTRNSLYEGSLFIKIDIDALKCRYQLGLETLLAYTVNYEY